MISLYTSQGKNVLQKITYRDELKICNTPLHLSHKRGHAYKYI